jgi:outer membrane protein OmpA-like peptidoglycan-associated protein
MVIGHADQRGDDLSNYAISEARAAAVKNYITAGGIAPSRLSSRAVGESDLLTLANDDSAFALNRRTEFVFYGLLLG